MTATVKCPFCTLDEDFTRAQLHNHLITEGDNAGIWLADLVFKIHEKIEEIRYVMEGTGVFSYDGTDLEKELKSLLNGDVKQ